MAPADTTKVLGLDGAACARRRASRAAPITRWRAAARVDPLHLALGDDPHAGAGTSRCAQGSAVVAASRASAAARSRCCSSRNRGSPRCSRRPCRPRRARAGPSRPARYSAPDGVEGDLGRLGPHGKKAFDRRHALASSPRSIRVVQRGSFHLTSTRSGGGKQTALLTVVEPPTQLPWSTVKRQSSLCCISPSA